MNTFKIYTLGCKVNQYDSQVMRESLRQAGLAELTNGRKADFCIINTCTVTINADKQSRYLIRKAKRDNPKAKIVVTGCYAHSNAQDIRKISGADLILDNDSRNRILDFIIPGQNFSIGPDCGISGFGGHTRAFVKAQDGCNNFCSFCKVPYARGRSRSRKLNSIIEEARRLSGNGYKEIVLTGICLGDFGRDLDKSVDLVDLINGIENVDGILRIRLSSIEAKDVTDRLVKKMKTSAKLCPHLHIPFQSGDDKILKAMNRRDTRKDYLKLARKLKKNVKNIGISCDIMIGFPGEGEEEFRNTLDFLKKVEPMRAHIFCFQPRDLTPLANVKSGITTQELKRRFTVIKELTDDLALKFKKRFLNYKMDILFEDKKDGFWRGYSPNYLLTYLKTGGKLNLNNQLVKVRINGIGCSNLYADEKFLSV